MCYAGVGEGVGWTGLFTCERVEYVYKERLCLICILCAEAGYIFRFRFVASTGDLHCVRVLNKNRGI